MDFSTIYYLHLHELIINNWYEPFPLSYMNYQFSVDSFCNGNALYIEINNEAFAWTWNYYFYPHLTIGQFSFFFGLMERYLDDSALEIIDRLVPYLTMVAIEHDWPLYDDEIENFFLDYVVFWVLRCDCSDIYLDQLNCEELHMLICPEYAHRIYHDNFLNFLVFIFKLNYIKYYKYIIICLYLYYFIIFMLFILVLYIVLTKREFFTGLVIFIILILLFYSFC